MRSLWRLYKLLRRFLPDKLTIGAICLLVTIDVLFLNSINVEHPDVSADAKTTTNEPRGSILTEKLIEYQDPGISVTPIPTKTSKGTTQLSKAGKIPPVLDPFKDEWKKVSLPKYNMTIYVYSAFYDDRSKSRDSDPIIRVNIASKTKFKGFTSKMRCLVETNKGHIVTTSVQILMQREHFALPCSSFFVICQLNDIRGHELSRAQQKKAKILQKHQIVAVAVVDRDSAAPYANPKVMPAHFMRVNKFLSADATLSKSADTKSADKISVDVKSADQNSAVVKSADAKSADAKSADAKSADAKSADAKSADAKSADAKSADAKSADAKSADAKSADAKSADAKSADAKSAHKISADFKTAHKISADAKSADAKISVDEISAADANLAVCVKPFHFSFNRAVWLIEFIEMYKLQGVSHFIFYNHSLGAEVQAAIVHYQSHGWVTLLKWNLPLQSQKDIRTEAMFTAMNDCTLRSVGHFTFLALVDLDEFIFPTEGNLLSYLTRSMLDHPEVGSFVFRNVFHYMYWDNTTDLLEETWPGNDPPPYLVTQTKLKRTKTPNKHAQRSKYVIRPEHVTMIGNHVVWKLINGKRQMTISITEGLSHHYRICEFGGYDCLKKESVVDDSAQKWGPNLIRNVAAACNQIFGRKSCPQAPPLGSPW